MKFISALLFTALLSTGTLWLTDFQQAKNEAARSHKLIVLNFSGSDWCIPCIRLHNEIFESAAFKNYADSSLVLVNADFPRLKKNQLPAAQVKQNESLADKYNPHGTFPLTLLLDASGKILKQWEGYPGESPDQFVHNINAIADAGK